MERCRCCERLAPERAPGIRVGIDLVSVAEVERSLASFGDRFLCRVFTEAEVAYARRDVADDQATLERLAARFAAKEAVKKALALDEEGVGFRDIEVTRAPSGAPSVTLHGEARAVAESRGVTDLALSMSHEAAYATAVVVARLAETPSRGERARLTTRPFCSAHPSRRARRTFSRYGGLFR